MASYITLLRLVSKNIRAARESAGLTQQDVSSRSGLSYRHYQNIEAGRVNVTLETLYRLAQLYGVPLKELVRED